MLHYWPVNLRVARKFTGLPPKKLDLRVACKSTTSPLPANCVIHTFLFQAAIMWQHMLPQQGFQYIARFYSGCKHIEAQRKWPPFRRLYFQVHFPERKLLNF